MEKNWTVSYVKTEGEQPIPRPVRPRPAVKPWPEDHAAREKLVHNFARKISDLNRGLRRELTSSVNHQPSSLESAASKVCQLSLSYSPACDIRRSPLTRFSCRLDREAGRYWEHDWAQIVLRLMVREA